MPSSVFATVDPEMMPSATRSLAIPCLLTILWAASPAAADVVHLGDGRRIEGILTREAADRIEIQTGGGKLTLSGSLLENARVERESEARNALRRAGFDLGRGKGGEAEDQLGRALEGGISAREARAWCVAHRRSLKALLGSASPATRSAWIATIRRLGGLPAEPGQVLVAPKPTETPSGLREVEFPPGEDGRSPLHSAPARSSPIEDAAGTASAEAAHEDDLATSESISLSPSPGELPDEERDFLLAMAEMFHATGQSLVAADLLERLSPAALGRAAQSLGFVQSALLIQVKERLNAYDFRGASDTIGWMQMADLPITDGCESLLLIRWATFERGRGRFDRALEVLDARLRPSQPEVAKELMQKTLAEARKILVEAGQYDGAIALYEKWGDAAELRDVRGVCSDLYRQWGERLLQEDQPAQARKAFEEHLRLNPTASAAPLDLCDFRVRFAALGPRDPGSAFELGEWAAERGLISEAIRAFERAAGDERLRAVAGERIALLQTTIADAHMARCLEWFEKGDPERAVAELDQFPFVPSQRKMQLEIERLRRLCFQEIERREKIKPVECEILFQDAQRRYYLGDSEQAVRDVKRLLRQYADTPAAEPMRAFLRHAEARSRLEKLDGGPSPTADAMSAPAPGSPLDREIQDLLERLDM